MNVLSLFDGMSCGQIALNRAGIKYDNYYASEIDKYAIQVTQKNYPDTKQLGSVVDVKSTDLPKIDLLIGGSPCFTAENLVMTNDGYKPIKNIKIGDLVLTHNNRYKPVLKIGGEIKDTILIKSQGSSNIETTKNHPFYCYNKRGDLVWKNIGDFDKTDKTVSINWGIDKDDNIFTNTDLYILGRFLADGCCYKTKRKERKDSFIYKFKISVGKHEIEEFKSKVDDRFSYIEEKTTINAFIYRKDWVEIGEKFGKLAHNKYIPNFILDLPKERLKIFINGYMDGDGYQRKNSLYKRNTTVSEKLALTLSLALQKCFFGVSINYTNRPDKCVIEGRTVNQKNTYEVSYTEQFNKHSKFKCLDGYTAYNLTASKSFLDTGKNRVYNIEVEDDNSYIVNNLVVHNCQGFSLAGKQLNFEDERSKLFFEYIRILNDIRKTNPNVLFLLENVRMKKEYKDIITEYIGVEPIEIDSRLLSAQKRKRLYWTNIPNISIPEDKNILLKDIIVFDKKFKYPSQKRLDYIQRKIDKGWLKKSFNDINTEKSECLLASMYKQLQEFIWKDENDKLRFFHINEFERLQTVPDDYTMGVSETQRLKMLGNGWTVDVVAHIFSFMKEIETDEGLIEDDEETHLTNI
jgi:site-specific DNA-cytosine methylase